MRGKVSASRGHVETVRITPAYAGKSVTDAEDVTASEDHPRLCGEKEYASPATLTKRGSPPPMRGKVGESCHGVAPCRITPAYAGKSLCGRCGLGECRDHPRLCGEKPMPTGWMPRHTGSPPPMRGKATGGNVALGYRRITPAYAGKSFSMIRQRL